MRRVVHGLTLLAALMLGGCVSTAVAIVKAPFQLAGAAIDGVTTSQSERDEKRGRKLRKQEEAQAKSDAKIAKEHRKAAKAAAEERREAEERAEKARRKAERRG